MKERLIRSKYGGIAYPAETHEALEYFRDALEGAPEPEAVLQNDPMILIVPHIDFRVDISIYAKVYKRLAAMENFPETFVILGVGHKCPCHR